LSLVRYYCATALDGHIAESDDTLDWLLRYEGRYEGADSDEAHAGYESFYKGIGALLMGSVTYEWVLAHGDDWPYAGKPTWVLSSRELDRPEGEGVDVRVVDAKVPDPHRRDALRRRGARPLGRRRWERGVATRRSRPARPG